MKKRGCLFQKWRPQCLPCHLELSRLKDAPVNTREQDTRRARGANPLVRSLTRRPPTDHNRKGTRRASNTADSHTVCKRTANSSASTKKKTRKETMAKHERKGIPEGRNWIPFANGHACTRKNGEQEREPVEKTRMSISMITSRGNKRK